MGPNPQATVEADEAGLWGMSLRCLAQALGHPRQGGKFSKTGLFSLRWKAAWGQRAGGPSVYGVMYGGRGKPNRHKKWMDPPRGSSGLL